MEPSLRAHDNFPQSSHPNLRRGGTVTAIIIISRARITPCPHLGHTLNSNFLCYYLAPAWAGASRVGGGVKLIILSGQYYLGTMNILYYKFNEARSFN